MDSHNKKVGADGQMELFGVSRRDMPDAERLRAFQGKLYQKAKQEKKFKFYVLYDKMFVPYILREAWKRVKRNDGAPGIDGLSIRDIEGYGIDKYLKELGEELRCRTYRPKAVKRAMILKANGGKRPLGIPTVKDRIAQTACKLILEPIFEADFEESSHGFRPRRSSKDAMTAIKSHLQEGRTEVIDADLSKYFDTIPHGKLMIALKERVSDPRMIRLIKSWLKVPVFEDGQFKGGKRHSQGTPQGGVISPLLANIYLHLLDRIINNPRSLFYQYGVKIVRYADDFVLMGKSIPKVARDRLTDLIGRMGLTLNEDKTRDVKATETSFDFLGFTIRYSRDLFGKRSKYWDIIPSKKSELKIREKVRDYLDSHGHSPAKEVSDGLNSIIRGWINYYSIENVSYPRMSKRRLRHYMAFKLNRYFNRKSQRKCRLYRQKAFDLLVNQYGLIDPTKYTFERLPVNANEEVFRKAVCGKTARTD
jgi:group II intron reverse transcriptase/maturase